jgi:hypothetical protein
MQTRGTQADDAAEAWQPLPGVLTRLIAALLVRPAKEAAIATGVLKTQVSGEN